MFYGLWFDINVNDDDVVDDDVDDDDADDDKHISSQGEG